MASPDPSVPLDPETAALLEAFVIALKDGQVVNYLLVASYMCLIYDIILTFPDEHELVWKVKASFGSVMYVIMRYGNVLEQAITLTYYLRPGSPFEFCRIWFYFDEWFAYGLFIPTTVFMGLRTYALYRNQGSFYKWLIIFIIAGTSIGMFTALGLITKEIKFAPPPIPGLSCGFNIASAPKQATLFEFVVSTCFDFSVFALTALRVFHHFRMGNYRLTMVIFKDSLAYYTVLFFSGLATLLLYVVHIPTERQQLRALLIAPMKSMAVIIASRIVLNLRKIIISPNSLTVETLTTPPDHFNSSNLAPIQFLPSDSADSTTRQFDEVEDNSLVLDDVENVQEAKEYGNRPRNEL